MRVLRNRMNLQNLHFKRHGREGPLRDCFQVGFIFIYISL